VFDYLPGRTDITDVEEEGADSESDTELTAPDGSSGHIARVSADCTRLLELMRSGRTATTDRAEFVVLRDEVVDQLSEARFSGNAMERIVDALRPSTLGEVDAGGLVKMTSAAASCRKSRDRLIEANLRLVMWCSEVPVGRHAAY